MIISTAVLLHERYWLKELIKFIQEHNTSLMTKNKEFKEYNENLTDEMKKFIKHQQNIEKKI